MRFVSIGVTQRGGGRVEREIRAVIRNEVIDVEDFFLSLPPYLQVHCNAVGELAAKIFRWFVMDKVTAESDFDPDQLQQAARYYDIGLSLIPERLLSKVDNLSAPEYRVYQRHALYGARLLDNYRKTHISPSDELEHLWSAAAEIALCHHENWDGSGYPYGQMATAIPLAARITAIASCYENYTQGSPSRIPLSKEYALFEIIEQAGTSFDPQLVEVFRIHFLEECGDP